MARKYKYQEVKEYIENNSNCKLISNEYLGKREKLEMLCSCGKIFLKSFDNFKNKKRMECKDCGYKKCGNPSTYEEFKDFVEKNSNCILISDFYITDRVKLDFKCSCGNIFIVEPRVFKSNNKRQCNECGKKMYIKKNTKSLEVFEDEVLTLGKGEYKIIRPYVKNKIKVILKHKCGYEWEVYPNSFLKGVRCPKCAGNAKKSIEIFKNEIFNLVDNDYTILGEYKNNIEKIKINHNICGTSYAVRPSAFLAGARCPRCSGNMKRTTDTFKSEVYEIVGNEYSILGEYIDSNTKIEIQHNKCSYKYEVTPSCFINSKNRCPKCNESRGERAVSMYLETRRIEYRKEFVFKDCIADGKLRFDFAIFDKNDKIKYLIEYDGEQHYKSIEWFGGKGDFEKRKIHDEIKNKYCRKNNILLIRIPYWELNNIEKLLDQLLKLNFTK